MGKTVLLQLRNADVIVLNKVDLVTPEQLKAVRDWVGEQAPNCTIVQATQGQVPLVLLVGLNGDEGHLSPDDHNHDHDHAHPEHFVDYALWSDTCETPLSEAGFRAWAEALPQGVLRAKGLLYLVEDPETRYVFHLVGKRWELKHTGTWGTTPG